MTFSQKIDQKLHHCLKSQRTRLLLARELGQFWGQEKAFFDLYPALQTLQSNHSDPVTEFFEYSKNSGQTLIPVTSFNRDYYYQKAVKTVVAGHKDGLCLRVLYEDIEKDSLLRKIEEICSDFRLDPSAIDIVLDLKIFSHHNRPFEWYCEKLPHLTEWRTFTIASGAFPKDLSNFKVGQHLLPRLDWQSWRQAIRKPLPRIPTYGDYATLHPFLSSYTQG